MSLAEIARSAAVAGRIKPADCNRTEDEWRNVGSEFLDVSGNRLFDDVQIANACAPNVLSIVSWDEFTRDTAILAVKIKLRHNRLAGVIGCPRSGLRAAADIAIRLGVPLLSFNQDGNLVELGYGVRLSEKQFEGELIIVEDSAYSGRSIDKARKLAPIANAWYAVYATKASEQKLDASAKVVDSHWFDWHVFHCHDLMRERSMGFDWDGVLNLDCPNGCDDDGPLYLDWVGSVQPIRFPDWLPVIITARREAYRSQCENWLSRWGINVDKLVMFEGTFEERSQTRIGEWKAQKILEHNVDIFVESDLQQARDISISLGCRQVLTAC